MLDGLGSQSGQKILRGLGEPCRSCKPLIKPTVTQEKTAEWNASTDLTYTTKDQETGLLRASLGPNPP